jgi:cleavage and polyadenylation specificity factor subunit 1
MYSNITTGQIRGFFSLQNLLVAIPIYTNSLGPSLLEWLPNLPVQFIPRERAYSDIVFDPSTGLIVAESSLKAKFVSYDKDGNRIWEPDGARYSEH